MVLTHGDLCEMNFLVDESSGHLTGMIDWAETEVLPFGLSLWGLENILGYMDVHGWHYFDHHADLRALFWETFHSALAEDAALLRKQGAIESARRLGILLRYAFRWDENMRRRVVQDGDSGTRYLDAFFR
jgi:aminoglycoside phosphotransferase